MINNFAEGTIIRPLKDCVLVIPDVPQELEKNGVVIPATATAPLPIEGNWATVVADGDGPSHKRMCPKCERPLDVYGDDALKPGTRVLMDSAKSGDALMIGGVEHRMVRRAELLMALEE